MSVLVSAGTLWCLFALVLYLRLVGAAPRFRQAAGLLLGLQLVLLLASGYGVAGAYAVATYDVPGLALVLVGTAAAAALRGTAARGEHVGRGRNRPPW